MKSRRSNRSHGGCRLVKGALEEVRKLGLEVVPQCWFVREYIDRNPEFADLLHLPERANPKKTSQHLIVALRSNASDRAGEAAPGRMETGRYCEQHRGQSDKPSPRRSRVH